MKESPDRLAGTPLPRASCRAKSRERGGSRRSLAMRLIDVHRDEHPANEAQETPIRALIGDAAPRLHGRPTWTQVSPVWFPVPTTVLRLGRRPAAARASRSQGWPRPRPRSTGSRSSGPTDVPVWKTPAAASATVVAAKTKARIAMINRQRTRPRRRAIAKRCGRGCAGCSFAGDAQPRGERFSARANSSLHPLQSRSKAS